MSVPPQSSNDALSSILFPPPPSLPHPHQDVEMATLESEQQVVVEDSNEVVIVDDVVAPPPPPPLKEENQEHAKVVEFPDFSVDSCPLTKQ